VFLSAVKPEIVLALMPSGGWWLVVGGSLGWFCVATALACKFSR
jgi:hypothetical protein